MSQVEIPFLNPLHFVDVTPSTPPQYKTKYFDNYLYSDTLYDFQEKGHFYPEFLDIDLIILQMTADVSPITLDVIDKNGSIRLTETMLQIRVNKYEPGKYIYERSIDLTGMAGSCVYVRMTPAGNTSAAQRSEWFCVKSTTTNKSILVEYTNSRYHGDVIFETGIPPFRLRIPAMIENLAPGSLDKNYQDQVLNNTLLSSKPFENINLWVGSEFGVAPWIIRTLNWAFSCDTVLLDGKQYAKTDSSKWSEQGEDGLALKSYVIGLVPGINRASKIVNPSIDVNKKITLVYNLGGNVFGSIDSQGGTITTPVIDLE